MHLSARSNAKHVGLHDMTCTMVVKGLSDIQPVVWQHHYTRFRRCASQWTAYVDNSEIAYTINLVSLIEAGLQIEGRTLDPYYGYCGKCSIVRLVYHELRQALMAFP